MGVVTYLAAYWLDWNVTPSSADFGRPGPVVITTVSVISPMFVTTLWTLPAQPHLVTVTIPAG
jgi:hypothetical protein